MTSLKNCHIEVDTHTHTVLSGHAWSTLKENCEAAAAVGLKGLCLTEHGPAMKGAAPWFAPCSHKMLPQELFGVRIFPGLEFNIVDFEGNVDNDRPQPLWESISASPVCMMLSCLSELPSSIPPLILRPLITLV